jgi:hypothetical protein
MIKATPFEVFLSQALAFSRCGRSWASVFSALSAFVEDIAESRAKTIGCGCPDYLVCGIRNERLGLFSDRKCISFLQIHLRGSCLSC